MKSLTHNINTQSQDTTLECKCGQIYLLLCCSRSQLLLELMCILFGFSGKGFKCLEKDMNTVYSLIDG